MGLYIDEASRRNQLSSAEQKIKHSTAKIGECFRKLLDTSPKKKNDVELTRLFLEGVTEFVLYTSVRRELIADAGKDDLAAFIKREFEKHEKQAASKRPK